MLQQNVGLSKIHTFSRDELVFAELKGSRLFMTLAIIWTESF